MQRHSDLLTSNRNTVIATGALVFLALAVLSSSAMASEVSGNSIHFHNISATPDLAGYGKPVLINATVASQESPSNVEVQITKPDGSTTTESMTMTGTEFQNHRNYEYSFENTWQKGEYSYQITAQTSDNQETSSTGTFRIEANASMNVVTDQDRYGALQEIRLDRTKNLTLNTSDNFNTNTRKRFRRFLFSENYQTVSGTTSGIHTFTHEINEGDVHSLTESDGGLFGTDVFDGQYTYSTEYNTINNLTVQLNGVASGGALDIQVRNFDTSSWETAFTLDSTTEVDLSSTVCTTEAGCSSYLNSNNEIQLRAFASNGGVSADETYDIDYLTAAVETDEGEIDERESLENPGVGEDGNFKKRWYSSYSLEELPISRSADIKEAYMVFGVESGSGTGELYHTQNFGSSSPPTTVHQGNLPPESTQTNPVATFQTTNGRKALEVTQAVTETFQAGKEAVGFQFREQGQDQSYTLSSNRYLYVNYTAESELVNTGDTDTEGYLLMRTQELEDGSWQNVGFPTVDQTSGIYEVDSDEELNLADIWDSNGGFNTEDYREGVYRVLSGYVAEDGATLESWDGTPIRDSFRFEIFEPFLNLTTVETENEVNNAVNEYGTGDTIEFVNTTIGVSRTTAVNASTGIKLLDENGQLVPWGPDATAPCGDISAGGNCERNFSNSSSGYHIPRNAIAEISKPMTWSVSMDANNFGGRLNETLGFTLHHTPAGFESQIEDEDNKILRNNSAVYNFTVGNPWSQPLEDVNVTVSCNEDNLNCTEIGGSNQKIQVGSVASASTETVRFNVTTNSSTPTGFYGLNATVEYVNPGGERKVWEQRENEILAVRIAGALTQIIEAPDNVTRGQQGYEFNASTENTFNDPLTGVNSTWTVPQEWANTTGNLIKLEDSLPPGETFYHGFSSSVGSSAEVGPRDIVVDVTNDQLREDSAITTVDVYANTSLTVTVNQTDPAVNETIQVTGTLEWDNGTAISGEPVNFTDSTSGDILGEAITGSNGEATVTYAPDQPLGDHSLNGIYRGSDQIYTNPSAGNQIITVHKIPDVQNLQADPGVVGYGYPATLSADVTDSDDGVASVEVNVSYPNGTVTNHQMQDVGGNSYEYDFSNTWTAGLHNFTVIATDNAGKVNTSTASFTVDIEQSSSIGTRGFEFFPGENVTLTNSSYAWTLRDHDYRRPIEVTEVSGNQLKRFTSRFEIPNLGNDVQSDCSDLRVVENGTPRDLYVESCNPSGNTVAWAPTSVEASSTEGDLFAYYGDPDISEPANDTYAFPISDSGTYDPGSPSVFNTHQYNNGNSVFRKVEISVAEGNGNTLSVTVQARNITSGELVTLYDQTGVADGTTVLDEVYYQRPWYNEIQISASSEASGGGFDPQGDVSYTYNFTTPDLTDTQAGDEQDRFSSVLQNIGERPFRGKVMLEVFSNTTGVWNPVETVYNDATARNVASNGIIQLYQLWNPDPFYTNRRTPGFYRAVFKFVSPTGTILTDDGEIRRRSDFRLNPSQSNISVQNVEIYNVTAAGNQRTDTSDLEDSGTNTTFRVTGGESYRVEVELENDESASAPWQIDGSTDIRYINIHPDWTIDTANDIFYSNGTDTFTGGQRETAPGTTNVTWNSQGGEIKPGNSGSFSFIAQVPDETEAEREITFSVTDITFQETDRSDINVYENNNVRPQIDFFDLNVTDITRGETVKAFANWTKDIGSALAEYNTTTSSLSNFTVQPEETFTNYSFSTAQNWARGRHTFQFFATDYVGNQGASRTETFDVNGIASINATDLNETEATGGDPVEFACRVASDRNSPINNYDVQFYNETSQITTEPTDSNGWANISYTSNKLGEQLLTCNITEDNSRFYNVGVAEGTEQLKVIELVPPEYVDFGQSADRVFKTARNDTVKLFAKWNDNFQLDTALLESNETGSSLNSSLAEPQGLGGASDWSNFSVNVPDDIEPVDAGWRVWANDTSSNYNVTPEQGLEIWAFTTILDPETGPYQNPVTVEEESTFRCTVLQGNGSAAEGLPARFYDNSSGSMQQVDEKKINSEGFASFVRDYSSEQFVRQTCSIQRNDTLNMQPFEPDRSNYTEVLEVIREETIPPHIENNNYFLNTTDEFKPAAIKSSAQWNESIASARVEFNYTGNEFVDREIQGPYTNNWTNTTLQVNESWDVGTHYVKTSANDTTGNLNDTLRYLKFDIWGYSKVEWVSPTGKVGQGETELKCLVSDSQTDQPIENHQVGFYDNNNNLIGTNDTREDGTAIYNYDTSGQEAGNKTWSCRINDEPEIFYNASNQNSDSEEVELLAQEAGLVIGNLTRPVNDTVLAQNKTFTANLTVECRRSDCGEVTTALRYNQSGDAAGTVISETSDQPFHTVGSNPKTCSSSLARGGNCSVSWSVNATGSKDSSHALDAQMDGTATPVNETEDKIVGIDQILILDVDYNEVNFPQGNPGQVVPAPGNSEDEYSAKLDERSNDATGGAWIKMTNLTSTEGPDTPNRRIRPENTTWAFESTCSYSGSTPLHNSYTEIMDSVDAGESFTQCYWQENPYGKYAGIYTGTLTIKVNATN
jgi:hypothetical protein